MFPLTSSFKEEVVSGCKIKTLSQLIIHSTFISLAWPLERLSEYLFGQAGKMMTVKRIMKTAGITEKLDIC